MAKDDCPGFEGQSDLYGLGVRISLYVQLATMLSIPMLGLPRYNSFFVRSSFFLFVATWIVIVQQSAISRMRGSEIYFFSWLTLSQAVAIVFLQFNTFSSVAEMRKMLDGNRMLKINACFLIILALVACYYTWFFWKGLDILPGSECGRDYAFFFSKASIYGWLRTLQKVTWGFLMATSGICRSTVSLPVIVANINPICSGLLFLPCIYLMGRQASSMFEDMSDMEDHEVGHVFGDMIRQIRFQVSVPFLITAIFVTTFVTLSAELPIHWNGITGVQSIKPVGQLVPFVVAIGLSINVFYQVVKRYLLGDDGGGSTYDNDSDDGDGGEPFPRESTIRKCCDDANYLNSAMPPALTVR